MGSLREHQRRLAAVILAPDRAARDAASLGLAPPASGAPLAERLDAYVVGYPARIFDALDESFPALHHLLGEVAFGELAERYCRRAPPHLYSLNDVGAELPAMLAGDPLAERLPFVVDLALLEWRIARAFHAREKPPFDTRALAGWGLEDWERALLELQPSVAVVRSEWPVLDLWSLRETPRSSIDLAVEDRAQNVLVSRDGLSVRCELVDAPQALVLDALIEGATLGAALASLEATDGEVVDVSEWFAAWTSRGLIAGCAASSKR